MAVWYCGSASWNAVAPWAASTAYSVGDLVRQLAAPTAGNERVFRCTTAGTSGGTEPTWVITKGATTSDNTAVWTEVTGVSTYGWTAAHYRIANATAWMAAGDTLYVSHRHSYPTTTGYTITSPGTVSNPCLILCVNDSSTPPVALATTALEQISSTGGQAHSFVGAAYCYGVEFRQFCSVTGGNGVWNWTSTAAWWWKYENCLFNCIVPATGSGANRLNVGAAGASPADMSLELVNCTVMCNRPNTAFLSRARLTITGGVWACNSTTVFAALAGIYQVNQTVVRNMDLSAIGAGGSLVSTSGDMRNYTFTGCKISPSVTLFSSPLPASQGSTVVTLMGCEGRVYARGCFQGEISHETAVVRNRGAVDGVGLFSRKMVSTSGAFLFSPLASDPSTDWMESSGSQKTVTVHVANDGLTLTNADLWIEVDYLASANPGYTTTVSSRVADVFATPTDLPGGAAWTTPGLSSPVTQSVSLSFTPATRGPYRVRVCLARPSTTVYFCPKIAIS